MLPQLYSTSINSQWSFLPTPWTLTPGPFAISKTAGGGGRTTASNPKDSLKPNMEVTFTFWLPTIHHTHTLSLSLSLSHSVTKHTQTHTKGPDGDLSNLSTHVGQAPYLVCAACHNHRHLWFTQQQCGVSHINKSKISCFMVNTFTSVGLWLLSHKTFSFLWLYFFLLRSS